MRYQKYDAYKDSFVKWLGEIPEHWEGLPIKAVTTPISIKNKPDAELLSVYRDYGVIIKSSRDDNHNKASQDLSAYKYVQPTNLVLNKMKTWQGSMGVSEYEGIVSPAYIVCKTDQEKIHSKFLHHLLRCKNYIYEYNRLSYGIRTDQWDMRYDDFKNIPLFLPPKEEQKAIANFIDKKTSQIDTHIAKQEGLIELLKERRTAIINRVVTRGLDENIKFKDSGVEWLDEIPEHWEVKKLKYLSLVKRGSSPRPIDDPRYFDDKGEFAWVRIADVSKNSKYLLHTTQRLSKLGANKSTKIYPKQIFLSIAGTVGKPMIAKIKCCIHDGFVWFDKLNKKINIDYLYYIFLNGEAYKGLGKLGTQLNLNTDTVGMISVPLAPKDEQLEIVNYIKKEDDKFFTMFTSVQKEIAYLKEYRQSLISNAVTGKIKVI